MAEILIRTSVSCAIHDLCVCRVSYAASGDAVAEPGWFKEKVDPIRIDHGINNLVPVLCEHVDADGSPHGPRMLQYLSKTAGDEGLPAVFDIEHTPLGFSLFMAEMRNKDQRIDFLSKRLSGLEEAMEQEDEKNRLLKASLDRTPQELNRILLTISEKDALLRETKERLADLSVKLADSQVQNGRLETDLKTLKSQVSDMTAVSNSLMREISIEKAQTSALTQKLSLLEDADRRYHEARDNVVRLEKELEGTRLEVVRLNEVSNLCSEANKKLDARVVGLENRHEEDDKKMKTLSESLDRERAEKQKAQSRVAVLENTLERAEKTGRFEG